MRRVGILVSLAAEDTMASARLAALAQGLQELGWIVGRNVQIETRWGGGDPGKFREYAKDLVAQAPDVIVASGRSVMGPLLQLTRTVPIVVTAVTDPAKTLGIVADAANGPAAVAAKAPPRSVMNSRLLTQSPRRRGRAPSWVRRGREPWRS